MINKLKYIFHRGSYRKVLQKSSLLFVFHDKSNIEQYQIDKFNEVWEDAYKNIPFLKNGRIHISYLVVYLLFQNLVIGLYLPKKIF